MDRPNEDCHQVHIMFAKLIVAILVATASAFSPTSRIYRSSSLKMGFERYVKDLINDLGQLRGFLRTEVLFKRTSVFYHLLLLCFSTLLPIFGNYLLLI